MKKVRVNLKERSYQILIGKGILSNLKRELNRLKLGKVAVVVTNRTISRLHGKAFKQALRTQTAEIHILEVPDSEESKSAHRCIDLIKKLAKIDRGKGIFVIAFGGGVIGDLAGFCASVYRRGIPYIQVPTTLLAQVDSSIGGKVAIDLACGKNLVGSFYQPRLVLSEMRFLKSLKRKQIQEALAEIIKYAVIADMRLFQFLENNLEQILKNNLRKIEHIIEVCSKIKAKIVEKDEKDRTGKRMLLNLGHTAAHALEAAGKYSARYSHGASVALGMLIACRIAKELSLISSKQKDRIEKLITKAGLPTKIKALKTRDILKAQAHDKKFISGKNRFVLPVRIGKVVIKKNVPAGVILKAIKSMMAHKC